MKFRWSKLIFFKVLFLMLLFGFVVLRIFLLQSGVGPRLEALKDFEIFMNDWCRARQARTDFQSVLGRCQDQIRWTYERHGIRTNASRSFVSNWDLKPAGQFSRFFIQAVSSEGIMKMTGGDWWRILIRSPVASLRPTVFDLGNGSYEVVFLIVEPGVYHVQITLDYTSCEGFLDPPDNWFIIGNAQGKMQPRGTLRGRAKQDYLLQPLQGGEKITINIALPNGRGLFSFNSLSSDKLAKKYDFSCGMKCKLLWDGYGRWAENTWKPYLKVRQVNPISKTGLVNKTSNPIYNTLWIYGDSQAHRMHNEIQDTPLCGKIFKRCRLSINWVYKYMVEFPPQDDLDFDHSRITDDIKRVLDLPEMSNDNGKSVMVLNLGLHYLQSTNFSNYVKLLRGVVEVFKAHQRGGKSARIIWKTTTEISKQKDTNELLFSDFKRFFTSARVAMYNAYATSFMCGEGFEILDVHPLTASYPDGTGGPRMEYFKEHDIVHYKTHVTRPFENLLTEYLMGNIPDELTFENYQFL